MEREEMVSWFFGLTPFAYLWLRVPDERRRPALVFCPLTCVELWFGGCLVDINNIRFTSPQRGSAFPFAKEFGSGGEG